jgi:hypothetical protein
MQRRNHLIARRRAPAEAVFSAMKRHYGKGRARCCSLIVNAADYLAFATAYNLRRACVLLQASSESPPLTQSHPLTQPLDQARCAQRGVAPALRSPFSRGIQLGEGDDSVWSCAKTLI